MLKLKLFLSLLTVLTFVGNVSAAADLINDSPIQNASRDTENTLSWPAIPGENLSDMAYAFYPKNREMRRLFVARTLQLNPTIAPKLKASMEFEEPTLITIPTLKSLSKSRQAIRATKIANPNSQLNMSLNLNTAASEIPALLLQEYELLLSKNTFLKAELERLHEKINALQAKLSSLKLVFDKTLTLPNDTNTANNLDTTNLALEVNLPQTPAVKESLPAKKTFKNLDENSTNAVNSVAKQVKPFTQQSPESALVNPLIPSEKTEESSNLLNYILWAVFGFSALFALGVYLFKQYRWRKLREFSESVPMMDDTLSDFGGKWQDTDLGVENGAEKIPEQAEYIVEHQSVLNNSLPANNFMNTQMRNEQAKATSSLEEAKLLVSVSRTKDAIDHLKSTIETQPKTSINHWLYLLEIFRKLHLKEDFESYAQSLHHTFNVMTPVWYETNVANNAAIIVPQQLEDFAHIMLKLETVWPSDLAKVYLHSLLTDNRDGERVGFSKAVMDEILMLIALLDTRKDFD